MKTSSNASNTDATTNGDHLRITTWPSGAIEVPSIEVFTIERHQGEHGVWFQLMDRKPDDQKLPPDFYLREPFEVDVEDADSLAAFASTWGMFSDRDNRDVAAWGGSAADLMNIDAHSRGWSSRLRGGGQLWMSRSRLGRQLGLSDLDQGTLVHPAEIAFRVGMLRRFAGSVERWQLGRPFDDLWAPRGTETGWVPFRDHLNAALSVFQVSFEVHGQPPSRSMQQVTGYSAAALQLWNDLETASYRHCDECGRLFTRQRGRSRDYSRTTGVRFHDRACANRYTQREYRRRQKAKDTK